MRVEDEGVELVGQVVVVVDRLPVPQGRVQPAAELGLARGSRRRPTEGTHLAHRAQQRGDAARGGTDAAQAALARHGPEVGQGRAEVTLDVELTGDVCLCSAELAGVPQDAAQGVR